MADSLWASTNSHSSSALANAITGIGLVRGSALTQAGLRCRRSSPNAVPARSAQVVADITTGVRSSAKKVIECLGSVACHDHRVPQMASLQSADCLRLIVGIVFYQDNDLIAYRSLDPRHPRR